MGKLGFKHGVAVGALLCLALGATGGAVAKNLVNSAQIKNNSVQSRDIKDRTLLAGDLSAALASALTPPVNKAPIKVAVAPESDTRAARNCIRDSVTAVFCRDHQFSPSPGGALTAQWQNFGQGYAAVSFHRDPWGNVHLEGSARVKALYATADHYESVWVEDGGVPIFILPAGYRPSATLRFQVVTNSAEKLLEIRPNGWVIMDSKKSEPYVSLDGLRFRAG